MACDENPIAPTDNGTPTQRLIIRDGRGRFVKGSGGGPGNPYARRVARLRRELYRAVTPEDLRAVVRALVEKARAGDVAAIKELLDRTVGKARPIEDVVDPEAGPPLKVLVTYSDRNMMED
jgi:hypothetical protein